MAHDLLGDRPVFLSTAPVERSDRRLALLVVLVSVLIFIAAAPFARLQLPQVWAFIPIYESALAINDLITAVLLYAQFSTLRSRALLVLACGYLFTAVMVVPHALTFPGVFSPTGLLGAGTQSTAWLFMFWHGVFPLVVIAYALCKNDTDGTGLRRGSGRVVVLSSIIGVIGAVAGLTLLATTGQALLPSIMRGNNYTPVMIGVVSTVWILSFVALLALWMRRPHTKLDLWLMVVMCAWMFDVSLSAVLNAGRFDLGFYAGRIYGLLAATFVLLVLLLEMGALYARLARLLTAEQQHRRRESEVRRRIFDTSLDLILVVDRKGTFIQVSPSSEAILGYRPAELIGRSAAEFLYPDDLESARNEMRLARRGQLTRNFETRYLHKEGRIVTLAWTGVWSEPEQQHFFIGRDMTERIKLEQQLRQAQKLEAVGQLTGGVAHDFNNILTVIIGTIEIIAEAVAHQPKLAAIAKMIDEAAERGAQLTQHLLAFARKQPLQPRKTDINTLVTESARLLQPTLGEHIEIVAILADEVSAALVDPSQLTTALLNLAFNARDAMPEGGELTLETNNIVLDESYVKALGELQAGPYVMIAVSDTGTGIPAAIRDKVFEPFFTTKDVGKGTGLGLSMVYGFVKQSGGHISIYSEEGHGTTIRLYLPQLGEHLDILPDTAPLVPLEAGGETILVVEDAALVRNQVIVQLENLGYRTLAAATAADALQIVEEGKDFDLLFTDVIMPGGMNGRQLADEMVKRRPSVKVLYTSGYTENALLRRGQLDPGVLLLAKPYRKSDLARMIRQALAAAETEPPKTEVEGKVRAGMGSNPVFTNA